MENAQDAAPRERSKIFTLAVPVTVGGVSISEIAVRAPKVRDLKVIDGMRGNTANAALISQVSGTAPAIVDELDAEDYTAISTWLDGFLS